MDYERERFLDQIKNLNEYVISIKQEKFRKGLDLLSQKI